MRTQVVLLDAGGTLFTERSSRDAIYEQVLAGRGLVAPPGVIARQRAAVGETMPMSWEGHDAYTDAWFHQYVRRLLDALHCDLPPESVRAELAEHFCDPASFVVHADALLAIEALLEQGLRLGVVSNWSDRLPGLLEGLGLARYFEEVVVSAVVGHTKPDPRLFTHATERFGIPAESALHVGDHPLNDLAAARRAGLAALLVDREGDRPRGPEVLHSLEELPGRLA